MSLDLKVLAVGWLFVNLLARFIWHGVNCQLYCQWDYTRRCPFYVRPRRAPRSCSVLVSFLCLFGAQSIIPDGVRHQIH